MSNPVLLTNSNRENPICGICRENFEGGRKQWTHVGGEGHDPFHEKCLRGLIKRSLPCPYDGTSINPGPLVSRTEILFRKAKRVAFNSSLAMASGTGGLIGISAATAVGWLIGMIGVVGIAVAAEPVIGEDAAILVGTAVVIVALIRAGLELGEKLIAVIEAIFDHFWVSQNDQINIWLGIVAGVLITSLVITEDSGLIPVLITHALATAFFSGIATLMR